MLTWYALVGFVLVGCGKPEATKPHEPPPSTWAAPTPPSPELVRTGSNAPIDKPVHTSTNAERAELERAIAPYREEARKSYPDAKWRYLAGLPPGYHFFVVTDLHSPGAVESVFIAVTSIKGDRITGVINSNILTVAGYKAGDSYTLSEHDIIDWVIVRPDRSEEGNFVGKFLDEWSAKRQP